MEEVESMSYPNCYSQHGDLFKDKYLLIHSIIVCLWNQEIPWTILRTSCNCFCQLFFFFFMRNGSINELFIFLLQT